MPWLRDEASGKVVWQDPASGLIQVKQGSRIAQIAPEGVSDALIRQGWEPATPEEVAAYDQQKAGRDAPLTEKVAAGLEAAGRTAISAATAPVWLPAELAAQAAGLPPGSETENVRGEGVVKNLAAIYGEITGGEGERVAAEYEAEARERAQRQPEARFAGEVAGGFLVPYGGAGRVLSRGGAAAAEREAAKRAASANLGVADDLAASGALEQRAAAALPEGQVAPPPPALPPAPPRALPPGAMAPELPPGVAVPELPPGPTAAIETTGVRVGDDIAGQLPSNAIERAGIDAVEEFVPPPQGPVWQQVFDAPIVPPPSAIPRDVVARTESQVAASLLRQTDAAALSPVGAAALEASAPALAEVMAGSRISAGALMGAAFGAATASEDAYIHNAPLTAEMLVAHAGLGLVFGGAAEGLMVGASAAARAARQKLPGALNTAADLAPAGGAKDWLQEAADDATLRAFGVSPGPVKTFAKTYRTLNIKTARMAETGRGMRIVEFVDEATGQVRARLAREGEEGIPVFVRDETERLRRLVLAKEAVGDALGEFRKQADLFTSKHTVWQKELDLTAKQIFKDIDDNIIKPFEHEARITGDFGAVRDLREQLQLVQEHFTKNRSVQGLWEAARAIDKKVRAQRTHIQVGGVATDLQRESMARVIQDGVTTYIDRAAHARLAMDEAAGLAKFQRYLDLRGQFHDLSFLEDVGTLGEIQRRYGQSAISGYVLGVTSGLQGPLAGFRAYMFALAGRKALRAGNYVWALAADWAAKRFDRRLEKSVAAAISGKKVRGERAAGRPTDSPSYLRGRTQVVLGTSLTHSNLDHKRKLFAERVAAVSEVAADPMSAAVRVSHNTEAAQEAAPKVTTAVVSQSIRGAMFLASKIPPGAIQANPFSPQQPFIDVSEADMAKFGRYWDAVDKPLSILRDMSRGRLTLEQVETLKAVYPGVFERIKLIAMEKLAEMKKRPPYSVRSQLDMLLELNGAGEPSMRPGFQALLVNARVKVETDEQLAQEGAPAQPPGEGISRAAERMRPLSGQIESQFSR